jgi:hypothetical protein
MRRTVVLWLLAFLITSASAVYQRLTGPTHPVRGSVTVNGETLRYRLHRSHGGATDHPVSIPAAGAESRGTLFWKRFKTADEWTPVSMQMREGRFEAALPNQPPAGKLQYRVELNRGGGVTSIPEGDPVVIRFKGDVPMPVLVLHVITIFGAMLLSTRTGLEALARGAALRPLTLWTVLFLLVGGMILGPVVQKYAFGAYWTGWPFGHDLTDNKTAVAFLAWIAAWVALRRSVRPEGWVLGASLITLLIFLIPHSLMGSELDYSQQPPPS